MGVKQFVPSFFTDPRKKIDRLSGYALVVFAYFYFFVFQILVDIQTKFTDFETIIRAPIMALLILPLINRGIIKPDPLQRSFSKGKKIRFFQRYFASNYLLERCQRCREDQNTCCNYLDDRSEKQNYYWFRLIFPEIENNHPGIKEETYEKGYTCKLLFIIVLFCKVFITISILALVAYHTYLYFIGQLEIMISGQQIAFLIACVMIWIIIGGLNRANINRPTGCWHAWRAINLSHITWMEINSAFLDDKICQANGIQKQFIQK